MVVGSASRLCTVSSPAKIALCAVLEVERGPSYCGGSSLLVVTMERARSMSGEGPSSPEGAALERARSRLVAAFLLLLTVAAAGAAALLPPEKSLPDTAMNRNRGG